MTIKELVARHGDLSKIPNAELYDFLCEPATRIELARLLSPYSDKIKESGEAKEKEQKEFLLKLATEKLEEFKRHPFVASVRDRCKKDLTWMTCYWTWETNPEGEGKHISENKITPESHGPILDLFVKKDDSRKLKDQDTCKTRLLLWPRGGMKSTIDVVDTAQWILNFPEIRILYLTGDDDLAQGFVKETKGHFLVKPNEPSLMNLFFPEFCFEEKDKGNVYEFNNPVWLAKKILRKEPTVQASSVGSGLGGRHYEVVKADDSVYDGNSGNEEVCKKVSTKISTTVRHGKALRFYGYLDIVGTRYHTYDYYGEVINLHNKMPEDVQTTSGNCWTVTFNSKKNEKILIGRAIVIKPEVAERLEKEGKPVTYTEAGPEGCDLLLPDVMPYSSLISEWMNNEETFEGQMNQNPRSASKTTFDRPLLVRSTVRWDELPYRGPVSLIWDFAGPFNSKKRGDRDFCTASAAVWNEKGHCFIIDILRNRYKPTDLAKAVVDFAVRHHPFIVGIEDASGARYLEPEIQRVAQQSGDQYVAQLLSRIDWITPENQFDAKKYRMAEMHPLLVHGLLKFSAVCPHLQTLYDEFERCMDGRGHDDIPDVISRQRRYANRILQMVAKPENNNNLVLSSPDKAAWNMLFAEGDCFGCVGGGIPQPLPIITPEREPEMQAEEYYAGVPNILGAGL
jgi:hypothetical protein